MLPQNFHLSAVSFFTVTGRSATFGGMAEEKKAMAMLRKQKANAKHRMQEMALRIAELECASARGPAQPSANGPSQNMVFDEEDHGEGV